MHWRWMDFVDALLSPLGFGLLVAFLVWTGRRRSPRTLIRAGIAIEIVCLFLSTPLGANALVSIEERRAPPPSACAMPLPDTIVVLSGGMRHDPRDARDIGVLNAASLHRTIAGAELATRMPGAVVVLSGGARVAGDVPQAAAMAELARRLGVDRARIRVEGESETTWSNARNVAALAPPIPRRIWLVTSAMHMPRALVAFRAAGFDACSYPADLRSAPLQGVEDVLPSGGAIANAAAALHEIVGEIVYRLRAALG